MDVVVLDHHRVETAPPALAHVNPNQPGDSSGLGHHLRRRRELSLLLVALNRHLRDGAWLLRKARGMAEPDLSAWRSDLVGLATVCDVVPLIGLNRAFVRCQGLGAVAWRSAPNGLDWRRWPEVGEGQARPITPYHFWASCFGPAHQCRWARRALQAWAQTYS